MEWVIHLLRQHSELAIFLTIAAGFWIGKIKVGQFSLESSPAYFWSEYW